MTTLKEVIKQHGFETTLASIMKQCLPRNQDEAVEMMKALVTGLTRTMAWECQRHIEDHDGYDCAEGIIEAVGEKVKSEAEMHLNDLLDALNMEPLSEPTSHNEQVAAEIMKEIDND